MCRAAHRSARAAVVGLISRWRLHSSPELALEHRTCNSAPIEVIVLRSHTGDACMIMTPVTTALARSGSQATNQPSDHTAHQLSMPPTHSTSHTKQDRSEDKRPVQQEAALRPHTATTPLHCTALPAIQHTADPPTTQSAVGQQHPSKQQHTAQLSTAHPTVTAAPSPAVSTSLRSCSLRRTCIRHHTERYPSSCTLLCPTEWSHTSSQRRTYSRHRSSQCRRSHMRSWSHWLRTNEDTYRRHRSHTQHRTHIHTLRGERTAENSRRAVSAVWQVCE